MSAPSVRRLAIDGTHNFRPVAPDVIPTGRLYRSDALHRLTATGRAQLRQLGITTVIDMRSTLDKQLGGRDRLRDTGAQHVAIPIAGVDRRVDPSALTLTGMYRTILASHQSELASVIRTIATSAAPVLVHCSAGKDRTGLVSALVLGSLGATRDQIVNDYVRTEHNLAGEWSDHLLTRVKRFGLTLTPDLVEVLTLSPALAMETTLDWIDAEYGGVPEYLRRIGITDDERAALRRTLLD